MPLDALPQLEAERLVVAAPGPTLGEIRNDRLQTVLRHVLLVNDEIVENRHEGNVDRIGRLLVDGGAGRAVPMIDPQDAALLLSRERNIRGRQQRQNRGGKRLQAPHISLPPSIFSASWRTNLSNDSM